MSPIKYISPLTPSNCRTLTGWLKWLKEFFNRHLYLPMRYKSCR